MLKITNPIKSWTSNHPLIFPILAFTIPLVVRTIPEILMGPYMVGFDTMGFYVPNAILWLHGGLNLRYFFASAPLFYLIYLPLVSLGGSIVLLIKVISPLLLAFLALTIFLFAKRAMKWSPAKSMFVSILGTVYFVALRASWDQLREELSLVFVFVVLMLLVDRENMSWKRLVPLSLAMLAVVLSDQIGAAIMLGVFLLTLIPELFHKRYIQTLKLASASIPAILYFAVFYLTGVSTSGFLGSATMASPLATWTGFSSYSTMLVSEGGFLLYCFLPLAPFIIISLKKLSNFQLRSWLLLTLVLLIVPTFVSPYRWVLLLAYPFAFYATEGLSMLRTIGKPRFRTSLYKAAAIYLILITAVLSVGFIFSNADNPFFYFNPQGVNKYADQIPSSMQQNTISIADCRSTVNVLDWFKSNVNNTGILLTHAAFYGWALLTLRQDQVQCYWFSSPLDAAKTASQDKDVQVYVIWWVSGRGWYGQPSLPSAFNQIYQNGEIALYLYNDSS